MSVSAPLKTKFKPKVKICGLRTEDTLRAAIEAGAAYVGFVFFEKSPRNISADEVAELIKIVPDTVKTVGVFVDPTDAFLSSVLKIAPLDIIQLHGTESPDRVTEIKRFGTVMKAISVSSADDIAAAIKYLPAADFLLFDAKPPQDFKTDLPGGNGLSFDWTLITDMKCPCPWMLSGGLNLGNIKEAIGLTNPQIIDISSGVESASGIKDIAKIKALMTAVNAA
jgi:phosphoribosylanthranilate isomerase